MIILYFIIVILLQHYMMSERAISEALLLERTKALHGANKIIETLNLRIQKLSEELKSKSTLLTTCMDVAHQQSLHLFSRKATPQDTLPCEPHSPKASSRPPPTKTTSKDPSWAEVIVRGRKTATTVPWNSPGPNSSRSAAPGPKQD